MYDDDLDALAAEYVLGTLAADERAHAEALIGIDPGFVEIVRQWERRLGELNVMVEAVEPPAEIWNKIKSGIATVAPGDEVRLAPLGSSPPAPPPLQPPLLPGAKAEADTKADAGIESKAKTAGEKSPLAALASTLMAADGAAAHAAEVRAEAKSPAESTLQPPSPLTAPTLARSAEVFYLARRLRRWRVIAASSGALAAVLAALIVVSQLEPGLIPAARIHIPQLFARTAAPAVPAATPGSRLVAVLQQDPSAPAFLLTIDPASRTLTVRRVAAKAEAGHSYQLWLIAANAAKPRSLGLVGDAEYTQRPLPAGFDADTIRTATCAVSFEPAGGSKTGAPSGPILFTGKLVESVPPAPPKA